MQMQRMIVLALILDFSVGAFGTKCPAGQKHKAALTNAFCTTSATDAASCGTNCCVKDDKKCGGVTVSCGFDSYARSNDVWKNTKTTDKTKATDCCQPKASCANTLYSCPAGKKKSTVSGVAASKCSSDPASCAVSATCCVNDISKCGGVAAPAVFCPAGKYQATDDVWKKTTITIAAGNGVATAAEKTLSCCAAQPTCASVQCKAGYKARTARKTQHPTAGAATFTDAQLYNAGNVLHGGLSCCEADPTKCGGTTPSCAAGTYYPGGAPVNNDDWKNQPKDKCCIAVATCAVAKCKAGYKKKAKVDGLSCANNHESCATGNKCCEKDTTKCGGLTGITCPYGSYDESTTFITAGTKKTPQATVDAWKNKPATEATKNTACCTAKAECKAEALGTTTPAAAAIAVTTTPAAPVRRYSEHKAAVEDGSVHPQGANMVWLGVGGLIGMAVLMAVQGLRSKLQAASTDYDAREAGMLLESPCTE